MKDELREAALVQYTHDYLVSDDDEIHFGNGFDAGFEAGQQELTAELKQLREFVGAMSRVAIEEWHGFYQDGEFWFFADDGEGIASGIDPFDAWRKMNAGEGEQ